MPFRVSRGAEAALDVIVVTLTDSLALHRPRRSGRCGLSRRDRRGHEGADRSRPPSLERGIDFDGLAALLPPGGARNAVDCALWDLTAKQHRTTVWKLAGLANPRRLTSSITLGIDTSTPPSPQVRAAIPHGP